ncbi:MAG: 3-phosphoserine/phosphohydroxythreonine transaminase [bacterium]
MSKRVFNYGAGPAMLPVPVMEQVQVEFLDYQGSGMSIIEMNHRKPYFMEIIAETKALFRELLELPENYQVLFSHGGGAMQFSSVPLNLMGRHPERKALYANTGFFSEMAMKEARRFGKVEMITSSEETGFDHIPHLDPAMVNGGGAAYLHITTNNTMMGTRWREFPHPLSVPLVGDFTSEIFSRKVDVTRFGVLYAGFQKNLGPPGHAVIIIRDDLLDCALPEIARQLSYGVLAETESMPSTPNVFNIWMCKLILEWTRGQGGAEAMEALSEKKAARIYGVIDASDFYTGHARPDSRSTQNYTFALPNEDLLAAFFAEAEAEGLHGMAPPLMRNDVRASLYNAMPYEGADTLASFMEDFERRRG